MSFIVVTCVGLGPTIDQLLVCTTYRTIMSTEKQACIAPLPPICKAFCAHLPKVPALFYLLVLQNSSQIQGVALPVEPSTYGSHIRNLYGWSFACLVGAPSFHSLPKEVVGSPLSFNSAKLPQGHGPDPEDI